jgi:hypothetical protein
MRCHICDKTLSEKEVTFNRDTKEWEPCSTCLGIAMDAAFPGGVKDDIVEGDILEDEDDNVDSYCYRALYDHCEGTTDD